MVYTSVVGCVGRTPLVELRRQFPPPGPVVIAKLELLNPSGSMKDRSARYIVESGLSDGTITPCSHLVESTSGNFGIALAVAARVHGLALTCVVDPKTTPANVRILRSLDARVDVVAEPDEHGCYLERRLRRVRELCELLAPGEIDDVVYVSDREAVAGCRALAASEGILAGGSSGAVVAALGRIRPELPPGSCVLTVLPDRGERYLDLVYDDAWVEALPAAAPHRSAEPVLTSH